MQLKHIIILWVSGAIMLASCNDNTSSMGIFPESDEITNSTGTYQLTTRSVALDSVKANSTTCFLGNITDPETNADITADFVAQFYTFEDYAFPSKGQMMGMLDGKDQKGVVQCDSIDVKLYYNSYYGDATNPMKLEAYLLSPTNILSEDSTYYTNQDFTEYIPAGSSPVASRVFTPTDYNDDEALQGSTAYAPNVHMRLSRQVGQSMLEKYYENPDYYHNSYTFIRNVMPGLYFRTSGGRGTMLKLYVSTMNLYFHYYDEKEDSVFTGMARFSATPEVIQSTRFKNGNMELLLNDNTCTYLKTPAGIATEMTLPVNEVFANEHASDSISMASVTLTRYNKPQDDYQLGTPSELLMVRKQDYNRFFREGQVSDNRTSYTTTFSSSYNTYTFTNIARLISYCRNEKASKSKEQGISEEEWERKNPDWNKVLLIPVTTSTSTVSNNGVSSSVQVSVNHDMSLTSIRLVGGDTKIDMQVIYSKFH